MKAEITIAQSTQAAIPELGRAEKISYYLVIGTGDEKVTMNIGKSTYDGVTKIINGNSKTK